MESGRQPGSADPTARDRRYAPYEAVCQIHDEFREALTLELLATQEADKREAIRLPQGVLAGFDGLAFHYVFTLAPPIPRWLRYPPGVLRFPGLPPMRTWFRLHDRRLLMSFIDDLGTVIPAGVLLWPNTSWMVAGLIDRIDDIAAAHMTGDAPRVPFHFSTALAAIGEQRPETGRAELRDLPRVPFGLDPDQVDAVLHAHASKVQWLWGPPGSGKTRTVGESCLQHAAAGRTLLVSGPTHASVDLVLDPVLDGLLAEVGHEDGRIIRIGQYPSKHLGREHADAILFPKVVERRRSALRAEALQVETEILELESRDTPPRSDELVLRRARLREIRERLADLPRRLLNEASVVAGTMYGVLLARLLQRDFGAVVLDEVSMAATPLAYAIGGLARDHLLMAGDFAQLPVPVACSEREAVSVLTTDVFRRARLHDDVARGVRPPALSVLRTQYRLPPSICDVVSEIFYAGMLRRSQPDCLPSPGSLVLVDTSPLGARVEGVSGSRRIKVHAKLVAELVAAVQAKRSARGQARARIRIVTPYRAQMRQIRRELQARGVQSVAEVSTVHRAQGSEIDIVVIDLTEAPGLPPSPFVRGEGPDDVGPRLLNTAVTRTREACIVVADAAFVMKVGGDTVREILERIRDVGLVVDAREVLARLASTGGTHVRPATSGMVPEGGPASRATGD